MLKDRLLYIDVIRVIACLMVVAVHSPLPTELTTATDTYLLAPFTYLMSPCNGLFFMISGALLLKTKDVEYNAFLRRRLPKLVIPIIVWSIVYMVIVCFRNNAGVNETIAFFSRYLVTMFFTSSEAVNGTLWFMYVLIGIYLLVPILTPWWQRASKREVEFYLALWTITMCYPYIRIFIDIPTNEWNMMYYFSGYLGYFILGAYLKRYPILRNRQKYVIMIGILGSVLLPVMTYLLLMLIGKESLWNSTLIWSMSISSASMCLVYFVLIQQSRFFNTNNKLTYFVSKLSPLTFGIYLMHVTGLWLFKYSGLFANVQYILSIPAIFILTFISVTSCIWLISKTPISKYVIGV